MDGNSLLAGPCIDSVVRSSSSSSRQHAERLTAEDKREERERLGHVKFVPERHVPDASGVGWRTKAGHFIKNQSFYPTMPKVNKWDVPALAGVNTWKEWHGPRLRTDADLMERLDRFDEVQDYRQAHKTFVNTTRVESLDRFYNQKVQRSQLESSPSWAPHRHARRQVHSSFETFDSGLDEKPVKELRKVLTKTVLQRDREAIRAIAGRIQVEETWKEAYKQMDQDRRNEIRTDFHQRQAFNDRLMQLSGQQIMSSSSSRELPNNCSRRSEELARPRPSAHPKDVTSVADFRGLIHADNEHALEALYPGSGHELSVEFRARATRSIEPGWPPPPPAETPRQPRRHTNREAKLQQDAILCRGSIPVSEYRLENIGTRRNQDMLLQHAKAQFLPATAPPPLDQRQTLMDEDFSPSTLLRDTARVTGCFSRTEQSSLAGSPSRKSVEELPPPTRSLVYPMIAPASPKAKLLQATPTSPMGSLAMGPQSSVRSMRRHESAPSILGSTSCDRRGQHRAVVSSVCQELDAFEANVTPIPCISNFFSTPRPCHRRLAGLSGLEFA